MHARSKPEEDIEKKVKKKKVKQKKGEKAKSNKLSTPVWCDLGKLRESERLKCFCVCVFSVCEQQ